MLVGPAGAGKNSLMQPLMDAMPRLSRLPTATTRTARPGEREGIDHFFVSLEQFNAMLARGELVEHQEVHPGKFYGTVRSVAQDRLNGGALLLADIDIFGAKMLKAAFPQNVRTIFVAPPSLKILEGRLRNRGNMPEKEIQDRLRRAEFELTQSGECDYRVINDDLDRCAAQVLDIIRAEVSAHQAGNPPPSN